MTPFQRFKKEYSGKHVLIMGLGLQGRGVQDAEFFASIGAEVTVTDLKNEDQLAPSLRKLQSYNIRYVLGKHEEEDFRGHDMVLRNADVPRESPYLAIARKAHIPIEMDEALFASFVTPKKLIGITGTRGKTTTTMLIYSVLSSFFPHVLLGGNIKGVATLPLLPHVKEDSRIVLELSSWQLQGFAWRGISPHVAVWTNIYEDHLNRYKDMNAYIQDKKAIYQSQQQKDMLVLSKKDPIVSNFFDEAKGKVFFFESDDVPTSWNLRVKGIHNKENIAAAMRVGRLFRIPLSKMRTVIESFKGVEERLEEIASIHGIIFVDDTTSTTPIAGLKALEAYEDVPIILLAGGASKDLNLSPFAQKIATQVKAVFLLSGTATKGLEQDIIRYGGQKKIYGIFDRFEQAVRKAYSVAKKGDVILLSPGCASFGLFQNEFDRGEQFQQIVENIADEEKKSNR
ncbi:MAG TPA: UDP-N-acetylmuramoyl-L-alanine--D-glutamate ligase [Patescibacteria group bacterium]|nr:UDP-N-acetylmuramoyl-L-alanine--D-glutamate ligase [Patescibacteria group bacterium]